MTEASVVDVVVGVSAIVAAVVVLWAPRLAGAVAFLVFGVFLTAVWALLKAPDIALAEAALGTGVTGALFIEAVTRERREPTRRRATALWSAAMALVLSVVLVAATGRLTTATPAAGLGPEVAARLGESGVDHPVTAVLLAFRSYDTFLEIAVLLVAVVAATALTQGRPAAVSGGLAKAENPLLASYLPRVFPVLVLIVGWILYAGAKLPGGAFQAGAVLGAALVLLRVCGRARISSSAANSAATAGMIAFLLTAAIGLLSGEWLALRGPSAEVIIVTLETVLTVAIGVALAALVQAVADVDRERVA
jgi:multisubunit Na+/H+ antiporter MnhB subunit